MGGQGQKHNFRCGIKILNCCYFWIIIEIILLILMPRRQIYSRVVVVGVAGGPVLVKCDERNDRERKFTHFNMYFRAFGVIVGLFLPLRPRSIIELRK